MRIRKYVPGFAYRFVGALLGTALCLAYLLGGCELLSLPVPHGVREAPGSEPMVMQEDDPGWDCAIMGNRQCG